MYKIGKLYKIKVKNNPNNLIFTGTILEEDSYSISINTINSEHRVINKESILDAMEWNGDGYGKSR